MTQYINVKVKISEGQKEKLQHTLKANCPTISIHLNHEDLNGNDILAVTRSQAKKMAKAYEDGKGITIRLTSKQLKHNKKTEGGFFRSFSWISCKSFTNGNKNCFTSVRCWCFIRISIIMSTKSNGQWFIS